MHVVEGCPTPQGRLLMSRRLASSMLVILTGLSLTGCMSVRDFERPTSAATASEQQLSQLPETPEDTVPPPAPPVEPVGSATWSMLSANGFSYDVTVSAFPALTGGSNGTHTIGSKCSFNPQVDIAIPVLVNFTATTEGFETPIKASFISKHQTNRAYQGAGVAPVREDKRLRVESYYSKETKCRTWSSTNLWGDTNLAGVEWDDPVPTGESREHRFTVIITNFRTPNTPDGDWELLDWIELRPTIAAASDTTTGQYSDVDGMNLNVSRRGLTLSGQVLE